jgi:hypothetical protein
MVYTYLERDILKIKRRVGGGWVVSMNGDDASKAPADAS